MTQNPHSGQQAQTSSNTGKKTPVRDAIPLAFAEAGTEKAPPQMPQTSSQAGEVTRPRHRAKLHRRSGGGLPALGALALSTSILAGCNAHTNTGLGPLLMSRALPPTTAIAQTHHTVTPVGKWPVLSADLAMPDSGELCYSMNVKDDNKGGFATKAAATVRILSDSAAGAYLVDTARKHDMKICFSFMEDEHGYMDVEARKLHVNWFASMPQTIATSGHEMTHFEQAMRGFEVSNHMEPRAVIYAVKVMEADAEAISNLITYQLEQKGYDFSGMVADEEFDEYRGIYQSFRYALPTANSGTAISQNQSANALRAAFNAWGDSTALSMTYEEGALISMFFDHTDTPSEDAPFQKQGAGTEYGSCYPDWYASTKTEHVQKKFDRIASRSGIGDYLARTGGLHSSRPIFGRITDPESLRLVGKIHVDIEGAPTCPATDKITMVIPSQKS